MNTARILGIILLVAAVIVAAYFLYTDLDEKRSLPVEALHHIPEDAALVIESRDVGSLWRDLSQSSQIWEELQSTDFYFRLHTMALMLDSSMSRRPGLRKLLSGQGAVLSAHPIGPRSYSFMLALPLQAMAGEEELRREIMEILSIRDMPKQRLYESVPIYEAQTPIWDEGIAFCRQGEVLTISLSTLLVESSIRAKNHGAHILHNPYFAEIRNTTDRSSRAQVFAHHPRLHALVAPYAASDQRQSAFFEDSYASWAAFDAELKGRSISLSGFTLAPDSGDFRLASYAGLKAPRVKALGYMPYNTSYFAYVGYGDIGQYLQARAETDEKQGNQHKKQRALRRHDETCQCDAKDLATNWMGGQAAAFMVEAKGKHGSEQSFALFQGLKPSQNESALQALEAAFAKNESQSQEEHIHEDQKVFKLLVGRLFGDVMGEAFALLDDPWALCLDDMVIMANSLSGLKTVAQLLETGKSMEQHECTKELASSVSSDAHFVLFNAPARSPELYASLLREDEAEKSKKNEDVLRKLQAMLYQVKHHKRGLYYTHLLLRHNSNYQPGMSALWESAEGAAWAGKVHLVQNHYTGSLEAVVQNEEHELNLLSATGKVLWKRALDGPIVGDLHQIDVFKNRKLQMLFATPTSIYLLDRNGNDVEGFPIALGEPLAAAPSVFDYDKSRDYRIFAPLQDGKVIAYDAFGKRVQGWSFAERDISLSRPMEHIRVGSKDYIMAVNTQGKLHLLDRQGRPRHVVDGKLPAGKVHHGYLLQPRGSIANGAYYVLDSAAVLRRLGFDGRSQKIDLPHKKALSGIFSKAEVEGEVICILQDAEGISAYSSEGKSIFNIKNTSLQPGIFGLLARGKTLKVFGAIDSNSGKVYAWTMDGKLLEGFPLAGDIQPSLADMHQDGHYQVISGSKQGELFGFSIPASW